MEDQNNNKNTKGLKRMTKPNSVPMRMASGGKGLIRDTSKVRKYKVAGESK